MMAASMSVEGTGPGHDLFARVSFFRRGAQQHDGARHRGGVFLVQGVEGEEGTDSGGGDDVVAARMPDLGQGIVFGEDRDRASVSGSRRRPQRRLHTVEAGLDVDSVILQHRGDRGDRIELFERRLGEIMDGVEQARKVALRGVEACGDSGPARLRDTGEVRDPLGGLLGPSPGLSGHLVEVAVVRCGRVAEVTDFAHGSQA
jgi:hypothetical protein